MSDFMQTLNQFGTIASQVGTIAGQVATVVGQVTGHTSGGINPGAPQPTYPQPGPMAQDRVQWSPAANPAPVQPAQPAPIQPAQSTGGFMQVLSTLFSKIAGFFKQLFGGAASAPVAAPATTARVAMADAREQLFSMFPTGQGAVLGLFPVNVTRYADRLIASAGAFGQAAIVKYQGDYLFYENNKPPVKVNSVVSSVSPAGDMHFDISLENGDKVSADILADGRTLHYDKYTLTLQ